MQMQSGFEFTMDANSNRNLIKRVMPLAAPAFPVQNATYSYNADNQLTAATGRTFGYDNNGNMLSIAGTNPATLAYDQLNRLTQYTSGGAAMSFQYDVLGNRIAKTANSTTTKYIGGLVETNSTGTITAYYVYGLGLISKIEGSSAYFYQYDGLGSTVAITDTTGAIRNKYAYNDFGQVATNATETVANPFKYVGKYGVQTDAPDLLYMRARYYMPSIGRFINKDPIGLAGGLNRYSYVGGNPIKYIDPSGLKTILNSILEDIIQRFIEHYVIEGSVDILKKNADGSTKPFITIGFCFIPHGKEKGDSFFGVDFNGENEDIIWNGRVDIFFPETLDNTVGNGGVYPGGIYEP